MSWTQIHTLAASSADPASKNGVFSISGNGRNRMSFLNTRADAPQHLPNSKEPPHEKNSDQIEFVPVHSEHEPEGTNEQRSDRQEQRNRPSTAPFSDRKISHGSHGQNQQCKVIRAGVVANE